MQMRKVLLLAALLALPARAESAAEWLQKGYPDRTLLQARAYPGAEAWLLRTDAYLLLAHERTRPRYLLEQLASLPPTPQTLLMRGRLHLKLKEWTTAQGLLDAALVDADPLTAARVQAARTLVQVATDRLNEARASLRSARDANLDDARFWFELAEAESAVGSWHTGEGFDPAPWLWFRQLALQRSWPQWAAQCERKLATGYFVARDSARSLQMGKNAAAHFTQTEDYTELELTVSEIAARSPVGNDRLARAAWLDAEAAACPPAARYAYTWAAQQVKNFDLAAAQRSLQLAATDRQRLDVWRRINKERPTAEGLQTEWKLESALLAVPELAAIQSPPDPVARSLASAALERDNNPEAMRDQLWQAWQQARGRQGFDLSEEDVFRQLELNFGRSGLTDDALQLDAIRWKQRDQGGYLRSLVRRLGPGTADADRERELTAGWHDVQRQALLRAHADELSAYEDRLLNHLHAARRSDDQNELYSHLEELADLLEFEGRREEALQTQRSASGLRPDDLFAQRDLGSMLLRQGHPGQALPVLQHALSLSQQSRSVGEETFLHVHLASCLLRLKRRLEARAEVETAMKLSAAEDSRLPQLEELDLLTAGEEPDWNALQARAEAARGRRQLALLLQLGEARRRFGLPTADLWRQAWQAAAPMGGGAQARVALHWLPELSGEQAASVRHQTAAALRETARRLPPDCAPEFAAQPQVQQFLGAAPAPSAQGVHWLPRGELLRQLNSWKSADPEFDAALTQSSAELLAVQRSLGPREVYVACLPVSERIFVVGATRRGFLARSVVVERSRLRWLVSHAAGQQPEPAQELYTLLLEPWTSLLRDQDVWWAPQGALWYLAWDALQSRRGEPALLLWRSQQIWQGDGPSPGRVTPRVPALLLAAPGHPALPGVIHEVQSLARLLPGSRQLIGPQATSAGLRSELSRTSYSLLHLAAHSRLSRTQVNDSAVELSDGPLRLGRLLGMRLPPQCLVVLSSCQSGLGQAEPGREVNSLGSAFVLGGARGVVSTLWQVDDGASVLMFPAFYQGLTQGLPAGVALNRAARRLRKQRGYDAPAFWAAYQLQLRHPRGTSI